jgi:hypothetical protein
MRTIETTTNNSKYHTATMLIQRNVITSTNVQIYLQVDYCRKNKVKELGCRWDADLGLWYFDNKFDLDKYDEVCLYAKFYTSVEAVKTGEYTNEDISPYPSSTYDFKLIRDDDLIKTAIKSVQIVSGTAQYVKANKDKCMFR